MRLPGSEPSSAPYVWLSGAHGVAAWSTHGTCCTLAAVDLEDGRMSWSRSVTHNSSVPVVHRGLVIVGTSPRGPRSAVVAARDVATGAVKWTTPVVGRFGPSLFGDAAGTDVVIANRAGSVLSLDVGSGSLHWTSDPVEASDEAHPKIAGTRSSSQPLSAGRGRDRPQLRCGAPIGPVHSRGVRARVRGHCRPVRGARRERVRVCSVGFRAVAATLTPRPGLSLRDLTRPHPLSGGVTRWRHRLQRGRRPQRAEAQPREDSVAVVTMKQLLEAGVHFGHQTRRWNPKMRRFIFGERNGIYIIDLQQTLERIDTAYRFVRNTVADGGTVLFVGTKKQAQEPVQSQAQRCGMPYVNFRWLGGMLTNFQTVHARVAKLRELERMVDVRRDRADDQEGRPQGQARARQARAQPRRHHATSRSSRARSS